MRHTTMPAAMQLSNATTAKLFFPPRMELLSSEVTSAPEQANGVDPYETERNPRHLVSLPDNSADKLVAALSCRRPRKLKLSPYFSYLATIRYN